jgi:surface carbohydrate biosynthesis protein
MPKFKFSLNFRRSQQVALFDASGLSLLTKYIHQKDISIIDADHMNVFAALRMLATGKKSLFDYTVAYLKLFKPQFVFTFIDNNVDFYKIQLFLDAFLIGCSYFVLVNTMIPISLIVSI